MTGSPAGVQALAITWEQHRRTRELCAWLELPLHELSYSGSRIGRYVKLTFATLRLLSQHRPKAVYVQNPSLILNLIVLLARPFLGGYRILMDAHNEAVTPFTHAYWPITSLSQLTLRRADVTIVTNEPLATRVTDAGGRAHVLPDRLPTPPPLSPSFKPANAPFQVMIVATYAADEPIKEVIEAARMLGPDYRLHITGRETKLPAEERARLPDNVKQTGFLPEHDYWQLMLDSDVVVDFTLKPDCLVCGAYESLALSRPMILSPNPPTRALFHKGAIFVESHTPAAIADSIRDARDRLGELQKDVLEATHEFPQQWEQQARALKRVIDGWCETAIAASAPASPPTAS